MRNSYFRMLTLAFAIGTAVTPAAASAQDMASDHHAASGWKELDAYHTLMAASWHPAKSNDLKPIRARADSLSLAAKLWSESKVPAACDKAPIKAAIADVVSGSAKVAQLVSVNAADAELRAALSDVHDRFEVVEKGCQPGKAHH